MPRNSSRNQAILISCEPLSYSAEHAEVEIELSSMTLSCEARSYFASWKGIATGASFECDLHFESYWGEHWKGVRRATFAQPGVWLHDDVYLIQGAITGLDEEAKEMFVDCGVGFVFAMDALEGLQVDDRIEAEGCFLLFFPED